MRCLCSCACVWMRRCAVMNATACAQAIAHRAIMRKLRDWAAAAGSVGRRQRRSTPRQHAWRFSHLASAVAVTSAVTGSCALYSQPQAPGSHAHALCAPTGSVGAAGAGILAIGGHGGVKRLQATPHTPAGAGAGVPDGDDGHCACRPCDCASSPPVGSNDAACSQVPAVCTCGRRVPASMPADVVVKTLQAGTRGDTEWGFYEAQFRPSADAGSRTEVRLVWCWSGAPRRTILAPLAVAATDCST